MLTRRIPKADVFDSEIESNLLDFPRLEEYLLKTSELPRREVDALDLWEAQIQLCYLGSVDFSGVVKFDRDEMPGGFIQTHGMWNGSGSIQIAFHFWSGYCQVAEVK